MASETDAEEDLMEGLDAARGADDDDLYGDLYADVGQGKKVLKTELQELEERYERSQAQVQELEEKTAKLENERRILIKNISALFKTAQMEVKRKDVQISELRQDMAKARAYIESRLTRPASRDKERGGSVKPENRGERERSRSVDVAGVRRANESPSGEPSRHRPSQGPDSSSRFRDRPG
ncbi:hypothetical protein KFL_004600060 [Klebsormidium nitens]|uniref:Uncharacterized protein n=1 Tax=Klebsormidium nitens TaxID=105231 RepID=A0A1Y1ICV8_KLENI|nr:hypothetical protein KFL_004600060 [Klebsormidium nitens]|eukprot:GAQ88795.1 hypothetical protein KFL_004600060 [Klebsormidium nitens]